MEAPHVERRPARYARERAGVGESEPAGEICGRQPARQLHGASGLPASGEDPGFHRSSSGPGISRPGALGPRPPGAPRPGAPGTPRHVDPESRTAKKTTRPPGAGGATNVNCPTTPGRATARRRRYTRAATPPAPARRLRTARPTRKRPAASRRQAERGPPRVPLGSGNVARRWTGARTGREMSERELHLRLDARRPLTRHPRQLRHVAEQGGLTVPASPRSTRTWLWPARTPATSASSTSCSVDVVKQWAIPHGVLHGCKLLSRAMDFPANPRPPVGARGRLASDSGTSTDASRAGLGHAGSYGIHTRPQLEVTTKGHLPPTCAVSSTLLLMSEVRLLHRGRWRCSDSQLQFMPAAPTRQRRRQRRSDDEADDRARARRLGRRLGWNAVTNDSSTVATSSSFRLTASWSDRRRARTSGASSRRFKGRSCSPPTPTAASSSPTPRPATTNVKALVYIDAFIPDEADTLFRLGSHRVSVPTWRRSSRSRSQAAPTSPSNRTRTRRGPASPNALPMASIAARPRCSPPRNVPRYSNRARRGVRSTGLEDDPIVVADRDRRSRDPARPTRDYVQVGTTRRSKTTRLGHLSLVTHPGGVTKIIETAVPATS